MGKANKSESDTSGETTADAQGVDPGKVTVKAGGAKDAPKAKAKKFREFRGQQCEIIKTTKNTQTGAIYDLILHKRKVTNRRDHTASDAFVGHKLRRPGTGAEPLAKEVVVEEEE